MGFLAGLFTDHAGLPSSKRLVGIVGAFVLDAAFVAMTATAIVLALRHKTPLALDPILTGAIVTKVMASLGLTTVEKRPAAKAEAEIAVRRATGAIPAIPEGQ